MKQYLVLFALLLTLTACAQTPRAPNSAATQYQSSCDANHAADCVNLAHLYQNGTGVPQDTVKGSAFIQRAIDLNTKSCTAGTAQACMDAGDLYAQYANDLVAKNLLYRRACNLDSARACRGVADLYTTGTGVTKDPATAAEYLARACKLGDSTACK